MPPASETRKWAAPGDWALVRSHITRLYVDEARKLEDVMAIMATEYGHRGTLKMYKARIAKWGLRKYKKEDDMLFILHKTQERGLMGKKTTFVVRGKEMSLEEVYRYFVKRGGIPEKAAGKGAGGGVLVRPSTPAHISYSTPPPDSPDSGSFVSSFKGGTNTSPSTLDHSVGYSRVVAAPPGIPPGYALSYVKVEDVPRMFFTSSPGISSPLSSPQSLQISEELLFTIRTYFNGSFQSGNWISDGQEGCINVSTGESKEEDLGSFIDCCHSATKSIKVKNYVDARIMLSTACKLVKEILENEDPRALDILLEGLLYLHDNDLHQVVDIMRNYLSAMATEVFARCPDHPWRNIWRLLSIVEADQLQMAINQSWHCASDRFRENLGLFHGASLVCYLEYIRYGAMSSLAEENALRALLEECTSFTDNYTPMTNILFSLSDNLKRQGRFAEDEIYATELLRLARERNSYEELLWGLNALSMAQMHLGKRQEAEAHLRESIMLSMRKRGPNAPQAINNWIRLETWVRNWGEEERAVAIRGEFEGFIRQHDVIEEDPGVFEADTL